MPPRVFCLALLSCLTAAFAADAPAKYRPGDVFVPFTTKDQHEQSYTLEPGVRLIVVAFAMSPGKSANAFFEKQPADFLARHHAVFVSNIHGMPGVGRMFALPKMKKYPHRILLADEEHFLDRYPSEEDKLTVFRLDDRGAIAAIEFVDPKKNLAGVFAAPD